MKTVMYASTTPAREVAARPQEQVLGDLHRDRAGAAHALARRVVVGRLAERGPVEAGMLAEPIVLRCDHRARYGRRHALQISP